MSRDVSLPSQWQTLLASLRAELSYDKLIPTLVGAFSAVIGLSSLYLSFAALIFSGELAPMCQSGLACLWLVVLSRWRWLRSAVRCRVSSL
ncbi:MAG: hypothetical protein HC914_21180, partial [Chloroflexaceae bacterium]|nr:hypothetical protein [Chloroflexaceae bacterium]